MTETFQSKESAVFLDTSIQIARFIGEPEIKERIRARIREFKFSVTSLVVRGEFKRRLLRDADYLLRKIDRYGSYRKAMYAVTRLSAHHSRKEKICERLSLEILPRLFGTETEEEQTARARVTLKSLIKTGLKEFDDGVGSVLKDSGCACGCASIQAKRGGATFEFGTEKCSQRGGCGVERFLNDRRDTLLKLLTHLRQIPAEKRTQEISKSIDFLETYCGSAKDARSAQPCLKVGDLLISLESAEIRSFYTLNGKESQHLCRALRQTLIVCRTDPESDDVVCAAKAPVWPEF